MMFSRLILLAAYSIAMKMTRNTPSTLTAMLSHGNW